MTIHELEGSYTIEGANQDAAAGAYTGQLELSINDHHQIIALWRIGTDQTQQGIGFFRDNILVINFEYLGVDDAIFKGVVVYKCLTNDFLEGFWQEELADPQFIGKEKAYRITTTKETFH